MTDLQLVNLTPHPFALYIDGRPVIVIASSGFARVGEIRSSAEPLRVAGIELPLVELGYAPTVTDLPDPRDGVRYIVSRITAAALVDRDDIVFPVDEVRGEDGQIVGCRSLGSFARSSA
ncbi:hypothetical protein [Millisia brevis]|uniref:hypothetical protein n=1 Tax=Millisia brevis TaxID=264148 RepID=UPI00082A2F1D|nr:hypothetical protein [Millisia brevis]